MPYPFTDTVNRVKEGAGAAKEGAEAVKEAAEAVSAVRVATAPVEPETIIIDCIHTTDTVVVLKEQTAYVPFAVDPEAVILTGGSSPEQAALTDQKREWDVVEHRYRSRPASEAEKARLDAARNRGNFLRRRMKANAKTQHET